MRATSYILDAALETLENRKSRYQSLGYQEEGCNENVNYSHNINEINPDKNMSKFTMILYLWLPKVIYC